MLTIMNGLKKNNIYKGFNKVVDDKNDGKEDRGKGKDKRVCGSFKEN